MYSTCNITDLVINGFRYSLNDIASIDFLYDEFENDRVESYIVGEALNERNTVKYHKKNKKFIIGYTIIILLLLYLHENIYKAYAL